MLLYKRQFLHHNYCQSCSKITSVPFCIPQNLCDYSGRCDSNTLNLTIRDLQSRPAHHLWSFPMLLEFKVSTPVGTSYKSATLATLPFICIIIRYLTSITRVVPYYTRRYAVTIRNKLPSCS